MHILTVDDMFLEIKDKIKIPATIQKHKIWDNLLQVTMSINIEQFNIWLYNHYSPGLFCIRELWYKFQEYTKDIFEYGYHFSNIKRINRFLKKKKCDISLADEVIKQVAEENNYIICNAAEIENFKISKDKNNIEFDIIATAYYNNTDPDMYIFSDSLPIDDPNELDKYLESLDKKESITIDDNNLNKLENEEEINEDKEELTDKEKEDKLLANYNETGILSNRIATRALYEDMHNLEDIEYCKKINIQPRVAAHIIKENNILALKFIITKRAFSREYIAYKSDTNLDNAWNIYSKDIFLNSKEYTNFGKDNINEYLLKNNFIFNSFINNIYDIDIQENKIIFWSDVIIE